MSKIRLPELRFAAPRNIAWELPDTVLARWNPGIRAAAKEDDDNTISMYDPIGMDWLGEGVSIDDFDITVDGPDSDLTVSDESLTGSNQKINFKVSGGTVRKSYVVTCEITTDETPAQTEQRSVTYRIADQ